MMPLVGSLERILLGNPLGGSYAGSVKSMWEQGSINTDTGGEISSGTGVRSGYLDARENAYYTQRTIGWGTFDRISWYFYNREKEFLGVKTDTTWIALELAPVNCAYIRLVISNDTPISTVDVPDITLEDRSIWGWKDPNQSRVISASKNVDMVSDHYYYQQNINAFSAVMVGITMTIPSGGMVKASKNCKQCHFYIYEREGATPLNIGDLIFEDRDVWGWSLIDNKFMLSTLLPIAKRVVTASYTGDLKNAQLIVYNQGVTEQKTLSLPVENVPIDGKYVSYRLYIAKQDNPTITPADMVNHGTWTVTFSDPVSEVWKSDGSVYYTPHNSEIQKGKILTITPPESFKAVSLVVQDATGQNSHDITGGAEVTLSESTEWVYLSVSVDENPDVNLTNIDSYREQWSYSYKDIPAPAEPHWEGENFVFSASDIQVGKAYQKSGNDIVLVDDASSIALPIISNVSATWTILIDNSSGIPLAGVEIRKTSSGVSVGDGTIKANSGRSIILQDATGQVAFHFTKGSLTADTLYSAIKIHGR